MNRIVKILMDRDEMSKDEALAVLREAQLKVYEGVDPGYVLDEMLGLEPDYLEDLL